MKTWNGDLSDLTSDEMLMFRHFHEGFMGFRYPERTKKAIKERVDIWIESGWPKRVIDIAAFMLLERMEREKDELEKWEKSQYKKLKRKYG